MSERAGMQVLGDSLQARRDECDAAAIQPNSAGLRCHTAQFSAAANVIQAR